MTATTTHEIRRGPAYWEVGGKRFTHERVITIHSDIRNTIFGPVDFGHTCIGPYRVVECDDA